jgi:hypothetical protein
MLFDNMLLIVESSPLGKLSAIIESTAEYLDKVEIDCHVERYAALAAIGRMEDAVVEKNRTLRMINFELDRDDLEEWERSLLISERNYLVNN